MQVRRRNGSAFALLYARARGPVKRRAPIASHAARSPRALSEACLMPIDSCGLLDEKPPRARSSQDLPARLLGIASVTRHTALAGQLAQVRLDRHGGVAVQTWVHIGVDAAD